MVSLRHISLSDFLINSELEKDFGDDSFSFSYLYNTLSTIHNNVLNFSIYYNDVCVGYISSNLIKNENDISFYISSIIINKEYRNKNIGSDVLTQFSNIVKNKKNVRYISLHVNANNTSAILLYKKLKFQFVKVDNSLTYHDGSNSIFLVKDLYQIETDYQYEITPEFLKLKLEEYNKNNRNKKRRKKM